MGQVTENTIRFILDYAEKGLHFPLTVNELQQLANLAACQLLNPPKHVDWDAVHKAIGKCAQGSYDVASTGTFLTPITSPAKVGGDERERFVQWYTRGTGKPISKNDRDAETAWDAWRAALSADGDMQLFFDRQQAGFERCYEALGITDDRERSWSALVLAITAALSADGGEDKRDAERYRFIRDVPHTVGVHSALTFQKNSIMDQVIDAAIAANQAKGDV